MFLFDDRKIVVFRFRNEWGEIVELQLRDATQELSDVELQEQIGSTVLQRRNDE